MRVLLDTHALIWWLYDAAQLSSAARAAIGDPDNEVFVSAVSALEVSTKHRLGKLPLAAILAAQFDQEVFSEGFNLLDLTSRHGQLAGNLQIDHKDPFDRALIAQSMIEQMMLVSNERRFDGFMANRLW